MHCGWATRRQNSSKHATSNIFSKTNSKSSNNHRSLSQTGGQVSKHAAHRVGDMMRFGLSTRLYLFGGPEELRPEEGLSKLQRRQLAALEVTRAITRASPCAVDLNPPCPACLPACLPASCVIVMHTLCQQHVSCALKFGELCCLARLPACLPATLPASLAQYIC